MTTLSLVLWDICYRAYSGAYSTQNTNRGFRCLKGYSEKDYWNSKTAYEKWITYQWHSSGRRAFYTTTSSFTTSLFVIRKAVLGNYDKIRQNWKTQYVVFCAQSGPTELKYDLVRINENRYRGHCSNIRSRDLRCSIRHFVRRTGDFITLLQL